MRPSSSVARRGFLAKLSALAAGIATLATPAELGSDSPLAGPAAANDPDAWIDRLTGQDKLILHAHYQLLPSVLGARNILANARDLYSVPERENSIVVATHGPAISGLFTDEIWQRFKIGERYELEDDSGVVLTRNLFLAPQPGNPPDAVIPALMEGSVMFIVCNIAIRNLSRRIAKQGESPEPIHRELAAGLLPGVIVVPDLFVSLSHAQKRGVSYLFID